MNILMMSVRSDIGGGPKHLYDLARTLKALSPSINIYIAAPFEKPFGKKFKEIATEYVPIPKRRFSLFSYLRLLNLIRLKNISVVHSHGRGAGIYGRLLALFGIKSVHTFHGIHLEPTLTGKIKLLTDRLLHHLTDQYICVSDDEKIKFFSLGFTKDIPLTVVLNGVDILAIQEQFKKNRQINTSFTLGTLARLQYQKGIDLLIDYVAKNRDYLKEKNILIKVAGDGPDKETLAQSIKEKNIANFLELIGPTHEPVKFLASLDCYISFARWEGLPLSVIEALSCGLPLLLSDVVGHGIFDELFDLNDHEDFNKKLDLIFKGPSELESSINLANKFFSLDKMSKQTYRLYSKN